MNPTIRRAIKSWLSWRSKVRLAATTRRFNQHTAWKREIDAQIAEARRRHKPVREMEERRQRAMTSELRGVQ